MLEFAGSMADLLLVVVGFGFIVFVHELGHFAAARWAGIRVLAFAIGFGPAALSFRKGLGVRRGSSEPEYQGLVEAARGTGGERRESARAALAGRVSPTEYRLNWLPFGGYVKMLGQDDLNPSAISGESDSYQRCPAWKRMVVISAGVVMNIILAAVLFVFVFMVGLKTEPPKVGAVVPGSPASKAVAEGVAEPGLIPGDVILSIDGEKPNSFNDLVLASAMAKRGQAIAVRVQRPGLADPVTFRVTPEPEPVTGLMMMGVEPGRSARIYDGGDGLTTAQIADALKRAGLDGVEPGMVLTRVGNAAAPTGQTLIDAIRESRGQPVGAEFTALGAPGTDGSRRVTVVIHPEPAMLIDRVRARDGTAGDGFVAVEHLLGLVPVLRVAPVDGINADANARARDLGLKDGDVFARLGTLEYPGIAEGVTEVRRYRGRAVPVIAERAKPDGGVEEVRLNVSVQRNGRIGFLVGDTGEDSTLLAAPLREVADAAGKPMPTAASSLNLRPGSRVLRIDGEPVRTFADMNRAIRAATAPRDGVYSETTLTLELELPLAAQEGGPPVETVRWTVPADDARRLHETGWTSRVGLGLFQPEDFVLKADGPFSAVAMGLEETRRVMLMTYVTFARLFQGTVKVEHLKGPVGIAHLGTRIADRGLIWLLFFMALISVNLAVVNFLPLPIVDGGQFLFLLYEQIRGRPVSLAIQNAATAAGLLMVVAVFLIVTFNDIANLFGG